MFGLDEVKICLGLLCFCFGFGLHTATASFASLPSTPSSFHCPVAQFGRGVWVHFFPVQTHHLQTRPGNPKMCFSHVFCSN
jgi:hypothetical protein